MKYISVFFVVILLISSCTNSQKFFDGWDEDDGTCDYTNCNTVEPFDALLSIKFTRNDENPNPVIYVKTGYYEDGTLSGKIKTDTVTGTIAHILVPINFNYAVYTSYKRGNDTIVVIDGAYVHKTSYEECDSTCWEIKNTRFNIKLK